MKIRFSFAALSLASMALGLVLVGAAQNAAPAAATAKTATKPMPLKVMTFNLRYASPKPPHSWPERRPVMSQCIEESQPDIIGTQEGVYYQLRDIAADRPEYAWIGQGRDGGSRGEFMAIFYRKERFEPLEYDYFWLSDTPSVVGSSTWGNQNIRMATWVKFLDKLTNQEFYFWNTHFDHVSQPAREKAATLILERINALNTTLPVILTGDFNAVAKANKTYDILTGAGALTDTWFSAAKRVGPDVATYHGYGPRKPNGARIDWILTRGPVTAHETGIVTFEKDGQQPSDHYPIFVNLTLGAQGPSTP